MADIDERLTGRWKVNYHTLCPVRQDKVDWFPTWRTEGSALYPHKPVMSLLDFTAIPIVM